ncbi:VOC family protein [Candidatus Parcubacteria bacterium]|nr:VOC family protein [Candidatus Parcubacteria bacterium]
MNRVVHFEIHVDDVERAKKFYSDVFGWEMQQMGSDFGNYVVIKTGPGPDEIAQGKVTMENVGINGGMMKRNAPKPAEGMSPMAFVCIVGVDNIDTYIEKARTAGGKEHMPKTPIPGVGIVAYYADLEGNIFGMIQPEMRKS